MKRSGSYFILSNQNDPKKSSEPRDFVVTMRLVSLSVLSLSLLCCRARRVANTNNILGQGLDDAAKLAIDPRRDHRQKWLRESEYRDYSPDKYDTLGSESPPRTFSVVRSGDNMDDKRQRRHLRTAEETKDEVPAEDATAWEKLIVDSGGSMTVPTAAPASAPTGAPSIVTRNPTQGPTSAPTSAPIITPTGTPTLPPSASPTLAPSPASYVARLIRSVALNGGDEFSNPDTYQSEALSWLEGSSIEGLNDERIIQRYSLACIYYATNQVRTIFTDERFGEGEVPPWQSSANWITDANECEWARITCDDTNSVTSVDLFSNIVTGEFPPEVVYMNRTLEVLDVGNNVVYSNGTTFSPYLGWLYQLTDLRTDRTNFESFDGIPVELANLKKLSYYTCESSLYRGPLNGDAFPSDLTELCKDLVDEVSLSGILTTHHPLSFFSCQLCWISKEIPMDRQYRMQSVCFRLFRTFTFDPRLSVEQLISW